MKYMIEIERSKEYGPIKTTIGPITARAAEAIAINLAGQVGVTAVKVRPSRAR